MAINGHATAPGVRPEVTGNAVDYFLDRHVREGRGARIAFIDDSGSITYEALAKATAGFASGLQREAVHRGTRIALILFDTIAFPIAFWGALRVGAVPVLINTLLPATQIRYILEDCRAEVAIVSAALLPELTALGDIPDLRFVVAAGDAASGSDLAAPEIPHTRCLDFTTFIAGDCDVRAVSASTDELAFLLYTSGSTGKPKGVRHVHSSLRFTADTFGAQVLGITADDLVFSVAKLFFAYGFGNAMTFPLSVGAAAVLSAGRATPERVLALIAQHRPTIFYGVPTLYANLLRQPGLSLGAGSDRLRCCISAGEALPMQIGKQWAKITGVDILDAVGSTEMLHAYLSSRPGAVRYGSCGRAVPGYDVRLVDEAGADIEGAGTGELLVRGESMADGYWNQRKRTRQTFLGEWTVTGDCYTRDSGGAYTFCGRTDDMFKVCGIWVSPVEVEASLISHEAVFAAAVVADQDGHGLTKPRAFVVLKQNTAISPQLVTQLQEHVKRQIGPWKFPRWVEFVPDLPETVTGKIQRFKLRGGKSTGAPSGPSTMAWPLFGRNGTAAAAMARGND